MRPHKKAPANGPSKMRWIVGAPIPTINAAVESRILSSLKAERVIASRILKGNTSPFTGDRDRLIELARKALYASKITSYAQGFGLLKAGIGGIQLRPELCGDRPHLARRLHHPRRPAERYYVVHSSATPTCPTCCWTMPSATLSWTTRQPGAKCCRPGSGWAFPCWQLGLAGLF